MMRVQIYYYTLCMCLCDKYQNLKRWLKYFAVHRHGLDTDAYQKKKMTIYICVNIPPILRLWNMKVKPCCFDVMISLGLDYH